MYVCVYVNTLYVSCKSETFIQFAKKKNLEWCAPVCVITIYILFSVSHRHVCVCVCMYDRWETHFSLFWLIFDDDYITHFISTAAHISVGSWKRLMNLDFLDNENLSEIIFIQKKKWKIFARICRKLTSQKYFWINICSK